MTARPQRFSRPYLRRLIRRFFEAFRNNSKLGFVFRLALSLIAGFFISLIKLDQFEFYFYDLRVSLAASSKVSDHVVIVKTDRYSVEYFKDYPGFREHRQLVKILAESNPSAIVYVSDVSKIKESPPDKNQFIKQITQTPGFFQVTSGWEKKGQTDPLKLNGEFAPVPLLAGPTTKDLGSFAKDGVTRRMMYTYRGKQLIYPELAKLVNPDATDPNKVRGLFPWIESDQLFIDFKRKGSFSTFKIEDVISGKISKEVFKDKLILVGEDLENDKEDYFQTPFSKSINAMTEVEIQANSFETLIQNSAPIRAPSWLNLLFTLLISLLTVHVVLTLKPLKGILILLGTAGGFTFFSFFSFWIFGFWVDMAHPYLAIFLCYYFFIPYRLIIENRRSWEYFQKHKLLSEVELLKTNFIGMMSHDLKTPLARIQGMTDVISQDSVAISSNQREALDTIKQSSEDLLKFISTILNYAKIESSGIELHKQAKDINQILKEVIQKHEFHAKLKHIQLIPELEPLFSIQVDPELIKQVFSNLVENAIKYSPEGSKILISSEELSDRILVQVADQGFGISPDELPNIFMKFFRSKDAKSSPIKGSGLGLYLAKYFVELHSGTLTCESTVGQGSTFTVELPLKPKAAL